MKPLRNQLTFSMSIALFWTCTATLANAQRGPAVVEVEPIVQTKLAPTKYTVGTVEPSRIAVIGSAVDGRVQAMYVREGDFVAKDAKLVQLLSETIRKEVEAAEAELEFKTQELKELENGSREEEIAQTSARLEASRIAAEYLEKDRQRVAALRAQSAISISEYEDTISLALGAQQRYAEAAAAHKLAVDGPRPERIAQARAQVAIREAVLQRLRDQEFKHTIFSRFDGYVTEEFTEVGQWVTRGEPVVEIIALDKVDVVARVLEMNIPFVHVGDLVEVVVPALPEEKFQGVVKAVVPKADPRSRTFPVKIEVLNRPAQLSKTQLTNSQRTTTPLNHSAGTFSPGKQLPSAEEPVLKAGMMASVDLPMDGKPRAMMISKDALVLNGDAKLVWTIISNSIIDGEGNMKLADAVAIPVTLGESEGEKIEVIGELQPGALVVTRGNERIPPSRPGQPPSKVTWAVNVEK